LAETFTFQDGVDLLCQRCPNLRYLDFPFRAVTHPLLMIINVLLVVLLYQTPSIQLRLSFFPPKVHRWPKLFFTLYLQYLCHCLFRVSIFFFRKYKKCVRGLIGGKVSLLMKAFPVPKNLCHLFVRWQKCAVSFTSNIASFLGG
jgi:hypothetical protein